MGWLVALLLTGCGKRRLEMPDGTVQPDDAFRLFAGLPASASVPAAVKHLQATGALWMDFTVCCRFVAPESVIDVILARGYEPTTWEAIASDMYPEFHTEGFTPPWAPEALQRKECFTKRIDEANSTVILHLVVDHQQGMVHAVGLGAAGP